MKTSELGGRETYSERVNALVLNTAAGDRKLTELAAEAVYYCMMDRSHFEANILLHKWANLNARTASKIRAWFLEYGPFTSANDRKISVDGKEIVVQNGVKFSEAALARNCGDRSPDEMFGRLSSMQTIPTWAKKKATPKTFTQEDLQKSVERLQKKAEENGLSFRKAVGVKDQDLFASVSNLVKESQNKQDLTQPQREFLARLIALAVDYSISI